MYMVLKPQDVVVASKLVTLGDVRWTYLQLYSELFISASEINAGMKRLLQARLVTRFDQQQVPIQANRSALLEFLLHGVKYAYPAQRGELTRGMPTAHGAPPLNRDLASTGELFPVWPDPEGSTRGFAFAPLYKTVPRAARLDAKLYEMLALVDAIRDGRARERRLAEKALERMLLAHE